MLYAHYNKSLGQYNYIVLYKHTNPLNAEFLNKFIILSQHHFKKDFNIQKRIRKVYNWAAFVESFYSL